MNTKSGRPRVIAESAEGTEGIVRMPASREAIERSAGRSSWNQSAFEQVFVENFGRVVAVLYRLLGDRAQAEEFANEVFWKLYRQPLLPTEEGNVPGWLFRTATNLGIDALRARAKRRQYEEAAGHPASTIEAAPDPLSDILRQEKCLRVRTVLAALRPAQAQILILRHSGFSYNELADALQVQRSSVGTMLMRAEAEFQKRYLASEGRS
jgi:RNA polymerase sigma-70 factor (ECF subfamily)